MIVQLSLTTSLFSEMKYEKYKMKEESTIPDTKLEAFFSGSS